MSLNTYLINKTLLSFIIISGVVYDFILFCYIINVLKKSDIDWRTLPRAYTESSKPKKQYNEIKLPEPKPKFKRTVRDEPKGSTDMSEVLSAITKLTDRKRALRAEIQEIDNTLASIVALCQGEQPYGGQNENTTEA